MVTHDLPLANAFDQILALRAGEVSASGSPEDVLRASVLRDVYDDPHVQSQQLGGQTHVWVDL
jgi:ABC-type hemin transport system ATPase subunit